MLQISINEGKVVYALDTSSYTPKDLARFLITLITPISVHFVSLIEALKAEYPSVYSELRKIYKNEEPLVHSTKIFGGQE